MPSMGSLVKLGATLAFNPMTMVQDALASVRRTVILIVCALVAGLIVLPAVGCLMAALWIFVQERLGPLWAAIITAAAMLLLAITVLLIGILQSKAGKKTRAQRDAPGSQRFARARGLRDQACAVQGNSPQKEAETADITRARG